MKGVRAAAALLGAWMYADVSGAAAQSVPRLSTPATRGALAAYAGNGVRMDFFEIDEAVIRIAENARYFTYLADAKARQGVTIRTTAIDGRLGLRAMPAASPRRPLRPVNYPRTPCVWIVTE